MAATKGTRNEARDRCLLLLMVRHGLRVSEACRLRLDQVDTYSRVLHVVRLKHGLSTTQPLRRDELKAISAWLEQRARMKPTGKTFSSLNSASRCIARASICCSTLAARPPPCPPWYIPKCCVMPAASPWPTREPTPGSSRIISDIGTFSTPRGILPPSQQASSSCGGKTALSPRLAPGRFCR
jgi:Phage integrase family